MSRLHGENLGDVVDWLEQLGSNPDFCASASYDLTSARRITDYSDVRLSTPVKTGALFMFSFMNSRFAEHGSARYGLRIPVWLPYTFLAQATLLH